MVNLYIQTTILEDDIFKPEPIFQQLTLIGNMHVLPEWH